ncbi:MAG: hypothetical protein IPL92_07075 [Saprospiraceae bacterium]|nr:hypothetical protein [Candidatus Opimibacter iunctus]
MKTIIAFIVVVLSGLHLSAQSQAEAFIKEAQQYLTQKNYKQATLSLQDAINDINTLIAGQISEALPAEINGLKADSDSEINATAMGMMGGGMQISKTYQHPTKRENQAELQILANSPMLASINMFMSNPAMMGEGYKSVRVGTKRAILKSEMDDYYDDNGTSKKIRSSELQLPLNQTLITINMKGFASEAEELAFAGKLDIDKLSTLLEN